MAALDTAGSTRAARSRIRARRVVDRKSTRLNSSHSQISYAVFCLKKKKKVVESLGVNRVSYFTDEFLGRHEAVQTKIEVELRTGHFDVLYRLTTDRVRLCKEQSRT